MLELVLIIIGIIILIVLLPYIIAIGIIVGVIVVIIFLAPKIWAFCKPFFTSVVWPFLQSIPSYIFSFLKWIFPFLPYVLGAILVLSIGVYIYTRFKYGAKIDKLNRHGIETASHFGKDAEALKRIGEARITGDGYIISVRFYRNMTREISQAKILSQGELKAYCFRYASKFQAVYFLPLLNYLCQQKMLFLFHDTDDTPSYLSQGFMAECVELFEKEGAATNDEMADVFENSPVISALHLESSSLAAVVLDNLASSDKAEKVDLSNSGEVLYVTKNLQSGSKLVRRELSMD